MSYDIDSRVERARARLDAQLARSEAARAEMSADLTDLRDVEATARADRGECQVTAKADGRIVSVRLNSRSTLGAEMEKALTSTISAAQRAAREAAADRAAALLGQSSQLVAEMRASTRGKG